MPNHNSNRITEMLGLFAGLVLLPCLAISDLVSKGLRKDVQCLLDIVFIAVGFVGWCAAICCMINSCMKCSNNEKAVKVQLVANFIFACIFIALLVWVVCRVLHEPKIEWWHYLIISSLFFCIVNTFRSAISMLSRLHL